MNPNHIASGRERKENILTTRIAQIVWSEGLLTDSRRKYHLTNSNLTRLIKVYTISHMGHENYLDRLRGQGRSPDDPDIKEAEDNISEAALYIRGLNQCKRKTSDIFIETQEKHISAIEFWVGEAERIGRWLNRPKFRHPGWVWAVDEPSDYEDGDGAFEYYEQEEIWDEYYVRSDENFI